MRTLLSWECLGTLHEGREWAGDVKQMLLDMCKIKSLGWRPQAQSAEVAKLTARELVAKSKMPIDMPKPIIWEMK